MPDTGDPIVAQVMACPECNATVWRVFIAVEGGAAHIVCHICRNAFPVEIKFGGRDG